MKKYRILESLIKKIYRIPETTVNRKLIETFRSASYNTLLKKKYLFTNNDDVYYVLKNHDIISKNIYINQKFNFEVLKKSLKYLNNNKKIYLVNIGAHVGTTLIPAIKANLFEKFIAFEPSINNFELLNANIFINQIHQKGNLYNLALSNKISKGYLKIFYNNSGDYRIVKKKENAEIVRLNILDNFSKKLNKHNSLIFIDAQGHEPKIFLGGTKTLKKKIPIVFELEPDIIQLSPKKIFSLIKHYNYLVDLREDKKNEMNLVNFLKIFDQYNNKNRKFHYTDLMLF